MGYTTLPEVWHPLFNRMVQIVNSTHILNVKENNWLLRHNVNIFASISLAAWLKEVSCDSFMSDRALFSFFSGPCFMGLYPISKLYINIILVQWRFPTFIFRENMAEIFNLTTYVKRSLRALYSFPLRHSFQILTSLSGFDTKMY